MEMLVSAVVDPSVLEKDRFATPGYREQAESFFEGIRCNGLIIVDPEGRLRTRLIEAISSLPTKEGQRLGILLAELLKKEGRKERACSVGSKSLPITGRTTSNSWLALRSTWKTNSARIWRCGIA